MHRSTRAGLLVGALLVAPLLAVAGCQGDAGRTLTAIEAEKQSLETTVPYAAAYKSLHPAEAQQVDDFYTVWRGRLAKETTAATQP